MWNKYLNTLNTIKKLTFAVVPHTQQLFSVMYCKTIASELLIRKLYFANTFGNIHTCFCLISQHLFFQLENLIQIPSFT